MKDLQIKKLYYSISEVSRMVELEQYVLRYWETEFEQLRPQKNRAGNRIYTDRDIELVRLIKRLTRERRYTIEGARQVLNSLSWDNGVPTLPDDGNGTPLEAPAKEATNIRDELLKVRQALVQLITRLERPGGS